MSIERIALLSIYAAATVAAILLVNAGKSNGLALVIWWAASVALGWRIKSPALALLAFLAIPLSLPFGYADDYSGSEAPWVPLFAAIAGTISALLIVLSAIVGGIIESRRRHRASL